MCTSLNLTLFWSVQVYFRNTPTWYNCCQLQTLISPNQEIKREFACRGAREERKHKLTWWTFGWLCWPDVRRSGSSQQMANHLILVLLQHLNRTLVHFHNCIIENHSSFLTVFTSMCDCHTTQNLKPSYNLCLKNGKWNCPSLLFRFMEGCRNLSFTHASSSWLEKALLKLQWQQVPGL